MSWFDTSGFASLAKTALKEAQKTIDKALDIKDEDRAQAMACAQTAGVSSDFFDTWGLNKEAASAEDTNNDKEIYMNRNQASTSIWGSFTGSFFENPKGEMTATSNKENVDRLHTKQQQTSLTSSKSFPESLLSKMGNKTLHDFATLTQSPTDPDISLLTTSKSDSLDEFDIEDTQSSSSSGSMSRFQQEASSRADDRSSSSSSSSREKEEETIKKSNVVVRKKENKASLNRLSVLSAESDKPSGSESVEVLSLQSGGTDCCSNNNTDCTNSPDSEVNSSSGSAAAAGQKVNSESVEILPNDSLVTSPSSVEVINDDWRSSSGGGGADESPYMSPMDENVSVCNESDGEDLKSSTSTLEGSQLASSSSWRASRTSKALHTSLTSNPYIGTAAADTADDQDEPSQADDSYASTSESTLLLTALESSQHSCPDSHSIHSTVSTTTTTTTSGSSPRADCPLNLSLDSLKDSSSTSKSKLQQQQQVPSVHHHHQQQQQQLPIEAITQQPFRKSETRLIKCSTTIEPASTLLDLDAHHHGSTAADNKCESLTRSSGSLIDGLTDSSCEETTLIGSSSEAETAIASGADKMPSPLTNSSYVKSMLAEAMSDKSETTATTEPGDKLPVRDNNSPISSESRSDLVKIGSDQTSGHTSGDELETTTTSSDIEIISSPNGGDSSCCSTQSRQSPAKLQQQYCKGAAADLIYSSSIRTLVKTRGHSRELSEISVGSDDANLEIERLLRRIREMTEILEARESKLIEVSRSNMELHEQNSTLKKQLGNVEKHAEHSQDITQITDEYTQRLSALERKFQQAIRERDSLRKSLEQMKQEAASRLSTAEISNINAEKDEIIEELREEGEKLSKQQLQLSNIIKKLRSKEKENDALIKSQKEQIEEQSIELERLKRSLHAKEEVERNQIEAVHTLTIKSKKQEKDILSLGEQLDHVTNKMEAYKKSFDAAKAELIDVKAKLSVVKEELKLATENAGESHQLFSQVKDLKLKLRLLEEAHVSKEKLLKQDNVDLLKRLEAAESRNEEMSESVSQATIPLLRQIEQLQSSLTYKSNTFMRQEEAMTDRIADLQSKLETITEMNRSLGEENANLKSRCSVLESKLNSRDADKKKFEQMLETLKENNRKLTDETEVHKHAMKMLEEAHSTEIKEFKREITSLENKLSMEKAATEAEKRKNQQQQTAGFDDEQQQLLRYSPSLVDMERESVSSANSSANQWPVVSSSFNEVMFESSSGRFANSTSMIENLQAQLKQREGEVQQLQWELSRRNIERDALNTEVSLLASKVEDLNSALAELETIKANLNDIQTKYDALLQMYGEKVEENQELQLDLSDVKEMYKTQIDQLLQRDR